MIHPDLTFEFNSKGLYLALWIILHNQLNGSL